MLVEICRKDKCLAVNADPSHCWEGEDWETRFRKVAIVADTVDPTPPCGACRQVLWEYCGDIRVILANLDGKCMKLHMRDLFPLPFDAGFLGA